MHFDLNEAPQLIVDVFLKYDPHLQIEIDETLNKFTFSSYPNHIKVKQDVGRYSYVHLLAKLFLEQVRHKQETAKLIYWQATETYRIINAAISSTQIHPDLRMQLIQIRKTLEKSDEIKLLLNSVTNNYSDSDIVCSGHGGADLQAGFLTNIAKENVQIVLYAGIGSITSLMLGEAIENELFYETPVGIVNRKTNRNLNPCTLPFPKIIDGKSYEAIPNFELVGKESDETKARVIEMKTGRILLELEPGEKITLSEIIEKFPGKKIHWAVCSVITDKNNLDLQFGPYAKHSWYTLDKRKMTGHRKINKPNYYLRLFKSLNAGNDEEDTKPRKSLRYT